MGHRPTLCLTFDHMGVAREVGAGRATRPDPASPDLAIGLPRILALLERFNIHATFFVEGWNGLHHPERIEELVALGHEVGLHGWVHERWLDLDSGRRERVLVDGLAALRSAGVVRPGFRAPGGYVGRETVALLAELGFGYDSSLLDESDRPEGHPRRIDGLVNVPFRWPWVDYWQCVLHPDVPATATTLFERWDREFAAATAAGVPMTVVVHPFFTAADDERMRGLTAWLTRLAEDPRVCFTTAGRLAASGETVC